MDGAKPLPARLAQPSSTSKKFRITKQSLKATGKGTLFIKENFSMVEHPTKLMKKFVEFPFNTMYKIKREI